MTLEEELLLTIDEKNALQEEVVRLKKERDDAEAKAKRLEEWRELLPEYLLNWRNVALGDECYRCGGSGVRSYPNTTMWRGGYGGQAITSGVCDGCWGSGGGESRGWYNLRELEAKLQQVTLLVDAVLESEASAPPGGTLEKLVELAKPLKPRKP